MRYYLRKHVVGLTGILTLCTVRVQVQVLVPPQQEARPGPSTSNKNLKHMALPTPTFRRKGFPAGMKQEVV